MMGLNGSQGIRARLLSGTSMAVILAVGIAVGSAGPAMAVNITSTNAGAATAQGDNDTLTFGTANAFGFIDTTGGTINNVTTTSVSEDGTLYIDDSGNAGNTTIDFDGAVTIESGKTLTVEMATDNTGGAGSDITLIFSGTVGDSAGTLVINSRDNSAVGDANKVDFELGITLSALTLNGGDGGAAAIGSTLELIDITTNSAITTLTMTGGTGATGDDFNGGVLTITLVAGDISGTTYTIGGGAGGAGDSDADGGDGGAIVEVAHTGAVSSTTFTIQGGAGAIGGTGGAGGAGGAVAFADMNGAITSTDLKILGGTGSIGLASDDSGIGGVGGAVTDADFDGAVGSIVTITGGTGGAGGAGTTAAGADGGAGGAVAGVEFTALVTGNVTLTGGVGGNAGASTLGIGGVGGAGGAVSVTQGGVGFTTGITGVLTLTGGAGGAGSTATTTIAGEAAGVGGAAESGDIATQIGNVVMTGGKAGAGGDGASGAGGGAGQVGGAVKVDDFTTSLTGDITMTGGAGSAGGAAGSGGTGGAGAAGGAVEITNIVIFKGSATSGGAITMTAGAGASAGASATGQNGGAAGAGGNVLITDVDGLADISTLTMTGGTGGAGSAAGTSTAGIAGGTAGTAVAGFTTNAKNNITTIVLTGGAAGNAGTTGTTAAGGAGADGGAVTLTIDNSALTAQDDTGSVAITITGGAGADGGDGGSTSGNGAAGAAGGAATLDLGGATTSANITLDDGTDGSAGTASGSGSGGAAGSGGVATAAFTATHTFTGNITAASDNEGVITTTGGVVVIVGSIGVSGTDLDQIDIDGGASGITINGNIFAKDIDITADDVLTFNGNSLQTVSAAIDANANTGDVTTGTSAIVTFNAALGKDSAGTTSALDAVTTGSTSTTIFKSTINAATLTLGTGTATFEDAVTLSGALAVANTTTITLGSGIIAGETVFNVTTNGSSFTTAATVNLPQTFNSGTITLVNDTGTTGAADALLLTLNSNVLVTYSAGVGSDSSILDITANKKASSAIASAIGSTADAAAALDAGVTAAAGDAEALTAYDTVLTAGGSEAKLAAEQSQPSPSTAGAASSVVASTGAIVVGVSSSRLASLRTGAAYASAAGTGFSGGEGAMAKAFWLKPFVNFGDQGKRSSIAGYDSTTGGVAVGGDIEVTDNTTIGVAFSYARTDVDSDDSSKSTTDIDSYQGTIYGGYTTENWFAEGMVAYARNTVDVSRKITFSGLDRIAKGSYNADQYMVRVGGGIPRKVGPAAFVTPSASFQWTHVTNGSYTETGAGDLNLTVSPEDIDVALLTAGLRFHRSFKVGGGALVPEIRVKVLYDVAGDEGTSTSTFTGGGAAFQTSSADVAQLGGALGVGLTFVSKGSFTLAANYDVDIKEDFVGHSGTLLARLTF